MDKRTALFDHPVIIPLLIALPGIVFLFGEAVYGFAAVAWKILALEILAILFVSKRIPLSLALYLVFVLIALLYLLGYTGRLSRETLILYPLSILIYHIYLLKQNQSIKAVMVKKRDFLFLAAILIWPLLFMQMEVGLAQRPHIFLSFYFLLSLGWKFLITRTSREAGRLEGPVAAEALLILLSLGLGSVPLLSPFGASFYGDSLEWMGVASLLLFLRLTFPKNV